ncbi:2-amino-4-hydroxy-6-hydroxymethyldihydropteridine diphosphokinase, partial [bacterium]|nr:2-amino-4-hydroxy-6-hydroxymethyldihydropteridine diphosphokinase [candidate division CSSED10-310 bacterium]
METVFIGIGSNWSHALARCSSAVNCLRRTTGIDCVEGSSWYRTQPFGPVEQPWFVNGVIRLRTDLKPQQMLDRCQKIEQMLGRRRTIRWGPRS